MSFFLTLGNLYTHTMFKSNKKSYQMKDDADEISVAIPTKKKHHHHIQKVSAVSEDEDDDESVTSDQSEDSISTKSSHVMSRKQSNSRNRGGRESTRTARSRSVRQLWEMGSFDSS